MQYSRTASFFYDNYHLPVFVNSLIFGPIIKKLTKNKN